MSTFTLVFLGSAMLVVSGIVLLLFGKEKISRALRSASSTSRKRHWLLPVAVVLAVALFWTPVSAWLASYIADGYVGNLTSWSADQIQIGLFILTILVAIAVAGKVIGGEALSRAGNAIAFAGGALLIGTAIALSFAAEWREAEYTDCTKQEDLPDRIGAGGSYITICPGSGPLRVLSASGMWLEATFASGFEDKYAEVLEGQPVSKFVRVTKTYVTPNSWDIYPVTLAHEPELEYQASPYEQRGLPHVRIHVKSVSTAL